jgi:hypothetical protein
MKYALWRRYSWFESMRGSSPPKTALGLDPAGVLQAKTGPLASSTNYPNKHKLLLKSAK